MKKNNKHTSLFAWIGAAVVVLAALFALSSFVLSTSDSEKTNEIPSSRERVGEMTSKTKAVSNVVTTTEDSVKVVSLLKEAKAQSAETPNWMLYFAKKFIDVPYVGGTLDKGDRENLIVNLRQLDCTTLIETVVALAMCAERGETSFADYCRHLVDVRYIDGKQEYDHRQHYFTIWIEDNEKQGIVTKVEPTADDLKNGTHPFRAIQHLSAVNYMSTHVSSYKMLAAHKEWLPGIKAMEQSMEGKEYRYIPKSTLSNTKENNALLKKYIRTGDILVILTSKKGLDTSHIGMAVWHDDGLHMLNASSIHHKVVDEPKLLYRYMQEHPSQLGIRVVRFK